MTSEDLHARRVSAVRAWTRFVEDGDGEADVVRPEILRSWQLSGVVSPGVTQAPLADEGDTADFWRQSPLQTAVERVQDELRRTAEDGDLVIAVTDDQTRILWTYGGRVMRRKAETVNFVPGGRWDEASVGTNALAIAGRTAAPSMVFSAEHYAEVVHNWVCWAAPVFDPVTGRSLGVIDWISRLLGSRPFHWLGELSYGAYLIHLLILQPVAAAVIGQFGTGLGAIGRFALTGAIVIPATYVLAFVTYRLVELPGQRLGKAVIKRAVGRGTPRAHQTVPEKIAAP